MVSALPTISIVTPSYNQAGYLDAAIRSIHDQGYPSVEHVIMDGGSTDGSVEIIRGHAAKLAHWQSAPDRGQYFAIQDGFARTSGEVMAWLNSDDQYTPWTFAVVGEIFQKFPEVEWLTTVFRLKWDGAGRAVNCSWQDGFSRQGFLRGEHLSGVSKFTKGYIQQESTFWRRSLWERAGSRLDTDLKYAADFELWARFFEHTDLYGVTTPLGGFRIHQEQKTANHLDEYLNEGRAVLHRHGGKPSGPLASLLRCGLARTLPPGGLRRAFIKLGLIYPEKLCTYASREGTGWQLDTI